MRATTADEQQPAAREQQPAAREPQPTADEQPFLTMAAAQTLAALPEDALRAIMCCMLRDGAFLNALGCVSCSFARLGRCELMWRELCTARWFVGRGPAAPRPPFASWRALAHAWSAREVGVRVAVRCRPLNAREQARDATSAVSIDERAGTVAIGGRTFAADRLFGEAAASEEVYRTLVAPLVEAVVEGFNGTVLVYGQTGAGKTYNMVGPQGWLPEADAEGTLLRGIGPRALAHLFELLGQSRGQHDHLVRISFMEIFRERITDLLARPPGGNGGGGGAGIGGEWARLRCRENPDGVYVEGLSSVVVSSLEEAAACFELGTTVLQRSTRLMGHNTRFSHMVMTVTVEARCRVEGGREGRAHSDGAVYHDITMGTLTLVDMAGSERSERVPTQSAAGGGYIASELTDMARFRSIHAVTAALTAKGGRQRHVPYRDSVLTRLLKDSLGGSTITAILAVLSPSDVEESTSTMSFLQRAKRIPNHPKLHHARDSLLARGEGAAWPPNVFRHHTLVDHAG